MKARLTILAVAVLLAAVGAARGGDADRATLCGRLSEHQGFTVLEVWGSPEEAGFAHGYLLAEGIVRLFDETVLDPSVGVAPAVYEGLLLAASRRMFAWQPDYERELEGLLRGMRAKLGVEGARSAKLDRPLELDDLKVVNTLADWRGMLCSTVSVWGKLTTDGRTLTARNLDYPATAEMRRGQCIMVRRGAGSARAWAAVGWPGLIGVYTAMNDAGVTIAIHDSGRLPPSYNSGFTPRSLALREALESAGAESFLVDVRRVLEKRRTMVGNNVHVSGPWRAGRAVTRSLTLGALIGPLAYARGSVPTRSLTLGALIGDGALIGGGGTTRRPAAGVFEYDGNERERGVTLRLAAGNGDGVTDALWCTNHMRSRLEPRAGRRYETLTRRLRELTAGGEKLDPRRAFELIGSVQRQDTLHTVLFVPDERRMLVRIRGVAGEIELRLDEWLARPACTSKYDLGSKP